MAKITYDNKEFLNENTQIADINKVKDTDLNEIKEVVNENYDEFLEKTNVIYDVTLENDASEIVVDSLDIVRDGGIYDVDLITFTTSSNDELIMNVNDIATNYYITTLATYGSTTGNNQTVTASYNAANRIEGWLYLTNTDVPIVTHMRMCLQKNYEDKYKLAFELSHNCTMTNRHSLIHMTGMNNASFNNMTKIKFSLRNNGGVFRKGTRVIVKKVI